MEIKSTLIQEGIINYLTFSLELNGLERYKHKNLAKLLMQLNKVSEFPAFTSLVGLIFQWQALLGFGKPFRNNYYQFLATIVEPKCRSLAYSTHR